MAWFEIPSGDKGGCVFCLPSTSRQRGGGGTEKSQQCVQLSHCYDKWLAETIEEKKDFMIYLDGLSCSTV